MERLKSLWYNGVECEFRANPDTFGPEIFYEGEWVPLETVDTEKVTSLPGFFRDEEGK